MWRYACDGVTARTVDALAAVSNHHYTVWAVPFVVSGRYPVTGRENIVKKKKVNSRVSRLGGRTRESRLGVRGGGGGAHTRPRRSGRPAGHRVPPVERERHRRSVVQPSRCAPVVSRAQSACPLGSRRRVHIPKVPHIPPDE